MIIEKRPWPGGAYPYKVTVTLKNTHKIYDVEYWAKNIGLDCVIAPRNSYFLTEQDALLFILKWSQ